MSAVLDSLSSIQWNTASTDIHFSWLRRQLSVCSSVCGHQMSC